MDGWNKYIDKKVYVELSSGRKYTGKIIEVSDPKSPVIFIVMKDKFDELVTFPVDEVKLIQEEK